MSKLASGILKAQAPFIPYSYSTSFPDSIGTLDVDMDVTWCMDMDVTWCILDGNY